MVDRSVGIMSQVDYFLILDARSARFGLRCTSKKYIFIFLLLQRFSRLILPELCNILAVLLFDMCVYYRNGMLTFLLS